MLHSRNFRDRVTVQTRTKVERTLGFDEEWTINSKILWASVVELDDKMTDQAGVVFMDQDQTSMKLIRVVLRGRRTMSVADTRIVWKNRIFKVLETPRYPSRSDAQFSVVFCHEVQDMGEPGTQNG